MTRISKKKKLKINVHRPTGTRVVFDEEGNALAPLARVAEAQSGNDAFLIDQGIWCNSGVAAIVGILWSRKTLPKPMQLTLISVPFNNSFLN